MRVRFAPSPTGQLHIGGARTALYNWLLARGAERPLGGRQGTLVLRIEDTDRERSTPENVEQILDALRWLGLDWDEGPIFQSQRSGRHAEVVEHLLRAGHAYRTTATADDVKAYKAVHGHDRGFRGEPESEGAVRLRVPDAPATVVSDLIVGDTSFPNASYDDPVIARADGSPVYNLAVAVDDLDAQISHVVRGVDHLSNTPKQLWVFEALGETPPQYAHLPLLHGPDGKKLSKRHGAASVQELREAGYLPEAVDNYVALLGAGFAADEEHFTLPQLAERFRLDRVSKNPAIFDAQKLRHINGRHMRELGVDELTARLEHFYDREGLHGAVEISAEKIQTLADFWPLAGFVFDGPVDDERAFQKTICGDIGVELLAAARGALESAPEPFGVASVQDALHAVVEQHEVKPGKVFQPIRVALAGGTVSPGIFETVALLGRDESLARIDRALEHARSACG
jgi:glutamyl-tRNA synthetase